MGWGSLVVTSKSYLSAAGPLGSIIGIAAGAVVMIVISRNYHYMIGCYPDPGGPYTYTKDTFGYDRGFLVSWFLSLTYAAVLWANATALPLFIRYFFGDFFRFGRLYNFFGYDVYVGEILLSLAAIVLVAVLCMSARKTVNVLMIGLVLTFTVVITVCFVGSASGGGVTANFEPGFVPDKSSLSQIIKIACISPWAFIGFENVAHASEEFSFSRKRIFHVLTAAVISATALYVFVFLLSISAHPAGCENWLDYIRNLDRFEGIEALPAFYAARHYLGGFGVGALIAALLPLIVTSLIGNTLALSRLFYSLAKDSVIPSGFAALNKKRIPYRAILLVILISIPIPFLGRTAIGWIVDVTTIGATIVYGFVSASALKVAIKRKSKVEIATGAVGVLIMVAFSLYLIIPSLYSEGTIEKETYFLFAAWCFLGLVFFRSVLKRDMHNRFGNSVIVWIVLLTVTTFISLLWMSRSVVNYAEGAMNEIREHYTEDEEVSDVRDADKMFVEEQLDKFETTSKITIAGVAVMFIASFGVMTANFAFMSKKHRDNLVELDRARDIANTDSLTGVKSKTAFTSAEIDIDLAIAAGTQKQFAIVVCDVNGLKHVNDTQGHKAGDEYIRSAARLISDVFGHSPVFRMGGDEFVVILTDRDFESRDALMKTLHGESVKNIADGKVVVSGGISDFVPGEDVSSHAVFDRADALMYEEKKALKSLGAKTR